MKLRATLVVEYEPEPVHYNTDDPAEMAAIDQKNWTRDPAMLLASFEDEEFTITVEPVTEEC
jgi:hypothetical protein